MRHFLSRTKLFFILIFLFLINPKIFSMDSVRVETRIDDAIAQFNLTGGEGVAVAVLDRGVDWRSNDFRNEDGTTRIAAIFDLTNDTGASWPNNPYGVGTIYSREQIDSALNNLRTLDFRDAVGHGCSTTGIILGNGRNSTDRKWRGVAPKATLICIKFTTEGAPAHGSEPPEDPFYDPSRLPAAIDFAVQTASQLGMPCVMLANFGSVGGPTDGTSEMCREIDSVFGDGIPGLVFVTGTSDDGGADNKAIYTLSQNETDTLKIQKSSSGSLILDLWYDGDDRFDVSINTPTTLYGPYPSPATNNNFTQISNSEFLFYHNGSNVAFYNPTNGKREIWLRIDGSPGDYELVLEGATVSNGKYDATLNPSRFSGQFSGNLFLNHVGEGSIWDLATAFNNIAPNSYVIRNSWVDIDGITRNVNEGDVGDLWFGSGVGPTFDGRLGVDISAPGDRVITTYGPDTYWATFRHNLIQGGNGVYGIASAVSAASPIVVGIIALMLEMKPDLDAVQVKEILHQSARSDNFTGTTPNTHWGYGKVDALNALTIISQLVGVQKDNSEIPQTFSLNQNYPNPFNPSTKIQFSIPYSSFITLEVFNTIGEKVGTLISNELNAGTYSYDWNAKNLSSGIYFYKLQAGSFVQTKKMILMK
jgi:hypothetical protein